MNTKRLDWDFDHHAPDPDRGYTHQTVRNKLHRVALELNDLIPDGREKSLMITKLEEAMFWANAGIARQDRSEDAR